MGELADVDSEDRSDEGQGQKDDCDDGKDHDGLGLPRCACGLVASKPSFEGVGVFLFEVEEVSY
jgi:hypothetical protein